MAKQLLNLFLPFLIVSAFSRLASAQHCPRAMNRTVYCSSQGCWGQTQQGWCSAPNDQSAECKRYQTTCCGRVYSFTVAQGSCPWGFLGGCVQPSEGEIAKRILVSSKGGAYVRAAIVMPVHGRNELERATSRDSESNPISNVGGN
jgi:hypothetical protein